MRLAVRRRGERGETSEVFWQGGVGFGALFFSQKYPMFG